MIYEGNIGIFGGSFNPVHRGHTELARYVAQRCGLDAVLMMLTPVNPFKAGDRTLISDVHRYNMLKIACEPYPELTPCDVELTLPRPTYTIGTLRYLAERYPQTRFRVIIGGDNWAVFDRWREHDAILQDFGLIVYPRPGQTIDIPVGDKNVAVVPGTPPLFDISSTAVRMALGQGASVSGVIDDRVMQYIRQNRLY